MKFRVVFARLVRETATVVVEAESRQHVLDNLGDLFERIDSSDLCDRYENDQFWGAEEATHYVNEEETDEEADITI